MSGLGCKVIGQLDHRCLYKISVSFGLTFLSSIMMRPDALAVCRAHRGLPVGFLLLWYPV